MKKLICFFCALMLLSIQAQGKAVKLGRNINATTSYHSAVRFDRSEGSSELEEIPETINCDANCQKCDEKTGTCLSCVVNRYLSDNLCLMCPEKTYCDGEAAIPNCTDVSCLSGSVAEATDTGCCCMPAGCEGVSCKSGTTPVANATGCCCV